jgi:hypothetical protein
MSDDKRFHAKFGVAACMVAVPVRVENELGFFRTESLERGFDLRRERRKLRVDHRNPVFADRNADIAALTFEHVNVSANLYCFDNNFLLLRLRFIPNASDMADMSKARVYRTEY